jgi:lipopolysaccharide transport system permease protein
VFYILVNQSLQWTMFALPALLVPLVLFCMGISWFISSLGVYLRDVRQVTTVLTTILLFLSPVFYPVSRLPDPYRTLMYLNPLTYFIEEGRAVMMWGSLPDLTDLLVCLCAGLATAWLGFVWFQKTRRGFADVL